MKKFSIFNFQFSINKSRIVFILLFILLGFVALQIPLSTLVGSSVKFTLFDLLAPISGTFLGTGLGVVAVFLMVRLTKVLSFVFFQHYLLFGILLG